MMQKITVEQFNNRLETLCLRRGGRGLPKKHSDQHILFKSIILMLDAERDYSENQLNQAIEQWLEDVGQAIEIDHVTLRRHLVDEGYLIRDLAGMSYRVDREARGELFEPEIDAINPIAVLEEAKRRTEERKRRYLDGKK